MIIYNDIFTGKTILTDSYKMRLVDDFYYEVEAKYMTKKCDAADELEQGISTDDFYHEVISTSGFDVIINCEDVEEYHEEPNFKKFMGVMRKIISKAATKVDEERHIVFKKKLNAFFKDGPASSEKFNYLQIFFSKDNIDLETGDIVAAPILVDADDTRMNAKIYYFKDLMVEEKM